MDDSRKRKVIWRAALTGAVFGLLSIGYISSYAVLEWLAGRAVIDPSLDQALIFRIESTVHAPILWYETTELPGAARLEVIGSWSRYQGQGTPESFGDVSDAVARIRERRSQ